jgi:hypothetical protein
VIGTSGIGVPLTSRTTPDTCVTSPTLSVVVFTVIDVMCTAGPTGVVVAESGVADVVSLSVVVVSVVVVVSPGASGIGFSTVSLGETRTVIEPEMPSTVAEIVVVPDVVPAVTRPTDETSAISFDAADHAMSALRMRLPRWSFTVALS